MLCEPLLETQGLKEKVAELEESAHVIADLASCLPDHSEWLWNLADRLTSEAAALQRQSSAA